MIQSPRSRVALPSLKEIEEEQARRRERAASAASSTWDGRPLWPDRYAGDDFDSAFRFLTECCWTDDDELQRVALIPSKDYLAQYVDDWITDRRDGAPSIYEKTRRVIVSWSARGLELWAMGRMRGSWLIVDQTHANSQEHLWRIHFLLEQLRKNRPDMNIPSHKADGSLDERLCESIVLANGSLLTQSYQGAGAVQGKGKTGITLEELSKYRNPVTYWAQAMIVTSGGSGRGGGWVNAICNPSSNPLWQELKGNLNARRLLGWE